MCHLLHILLSVFNNGLILQWGLYVKSKPAAQPVNINKKKNLLELINTKIINANACINYTKRSSHSGCSVIYVSSDQFTVSNISLCPDWKETNIIDSIYWICIGT